MYTKILILFVVILTSFSCTSHNDSNIVLELPKIWQFKTGDSAVFSDPGYNDKAWKQLNVESFWENQGVSNYDGIAWYRTHVVFPAAIKNQNNSIKGFKILLGRIDDADETYFNGKKIGSSGAWDVNRNYFLPYDLIRWDQENVIAVRVNDYAGNGGMYYSPHSINKLMLADLVSFRSDGIPVNASLIHDTKIARTIVFNFKIPVNKLEGTVRVRVYGIDDKINILKKEVHLTLKAKSDTSYSFIVNAKEPKAYRLEYMFFSKDFKDTLKNSTLLSYIQHPRIHEHSAYPLIKAVVPGKTEKFDISQINIGGYLNDRLSANLVKRLIQVDETGILECYYNRPGKQTWAGEYTGKYLHAASRAWSSTKNPQLKAQMDRIVDILISCQLEDGYLGTYLSADYWNDWDVWAHKYNMLGLLSYYNVTGYKPALDASIKMGDLLCKTFGEKQGLRNIIKSSPHIGMASTSVLEPMTELYRNTGDVKYLNFCKYIIEAYKDANGPKIISTLNTVGKVDKTADAKAYEMLSNLTGIVKLYQLTGDEKLLKATENAWNDITEHKLYITGTASKGEVFPEDFDLPATNGDHMGEGCVTTTWLQFSQALYYLTGKSKYIDEIEKSVYNHLLAAENPQTGCVSYYTALQGKKPYRCSIFGHCCLASVPRGIAAIPELAFAQNLNDGFDINFYTNGGFNAKIRTQDGKDVNVNFSMDSKFPEAGMTAIRINADKIYKYSIRLHVPIWCKNFEATICGQVFHGTPGEYLKIEKLWDEKSIILVNFSLNPTFLDGGKSYPGCIALKYGAQILAFDQSINPDIVEPDKLFIDTTSVLSVSKVSLPLGWVGSQIYMIKAKYTGKTVMLNLVPFADAGQSDGEVRVWLKRFDRK